MLLKKLPVLFAAAATLQKEQLFVHSAKQQDDCERWQFEIFNQWVKDTALTCLSGDNQDLKFLDNKAGVAVDVSVTQFNCYDEQDRNTLIKNNPDLDNFDNFCTALVAFPVIMDPNNCFFLYHDPNKLGRNDEIDYGLVRCAAVEKCSLFKPAANNKGLVSCTSREFNDTDENIDGGNLVIKTNNISQ